MIGNVRLRQNKFLKGPLTERRTLDVTGTRPDVCSLVLLKTLWSQGLAIVVKSEVELQWAVFSTDVDGGSSA